MAMKVPLNRTQVPIETPRTQAPRMPSITMPRTVPGAFGGDVAKATQALGEVGTKIATHLLQMAKNDQDREVLNRETEYRKDLQTRISNTEEETIKINNQDVTRPKGFLLRQLSQAKGATQELDKTYQEEIRSQYLNGLSRYQLDKLAPAMDGYYLSVRNSVITHEANQLDEDLKNVTEANLQQKILDASIIRDSDQLIAAIDDAINTTTTYNSKFDKATQEVLNAKTAESIAKSAIISTIERTGNYAQAKAMLDKIKERIPDSVYNTINDEIAKRAVDIAIASDMSLKQEDSVVMSELQKGKNGIFNFLSTSERIKAIKESQQRIFYNSQIEKRENTEQQGLRDDAIMAKFADGTLTLADIHNEWTIPEEQGGVPRKTLVAYQRVIQRGIAQDLNRVLNEKDYRGDKTKAAKQVQQYLDLINFMDENIDIWTAKEKIAEAYADGVINRNETVFLHKLRSNLKDLEFNRSTGVINGMIKGLKSFLNQNNASDEEITTELKKLLGTLAEGNTNPELISQRAQEYIRNKVPEASTFGEKGQLMMDGFGNRAMVYPDGRIEPYIEQPKTETKPQKPKEKK